MVKKLAIIREIFKGDHNAAAAVARKLTRNQISALSGTLNYLKRKIQNWILLNSLKSLIYPKLKN